MSRIFGSRFVLTSLTTALSGLASIGVALTLTFMLLPSTAAAQGVLLTDGDDGMNRLPRHRIRRVQPESSYRIKSIEINSTIDGQVAVTQVSQTFVNTGRRQIEASFVFPLPYDGAVDRMTFMVEGKEYEAKLLNAKKARDIYEGYMRRNQDPALLEWMGQGMFKTSVFPIPAGAERTVEIRYTQLLRQDGGVNDYLIPMSTAKYTSQPIEKFSIRSTINTTEKLKTVYSPTHDDIQVDRSGDNRAVVKLTRENYIPSNDVRIMYSEDNGSLGANLMSHWDDPNENGYFTLLVRPDIKASTEAPTKKSVLFVIDRSGSMNGKKIAQAREAAKFVLNNLQDGDLFNIITYSSDVQAFEPELQSYDSQTRAAALGYIEGIYAGGSTNIDGALSRTFDMIGEDAGPTYVLFLTDGLPTAGETNELKIAANVRQHNKENARVISFGVGFDVNSRLLDRMTRENNGQSQYVRPDEDLEEHVSNLYSKISAPVLTDVEIEYVINGKENREAVNRIYPSNDFDLFAGQQLVLVGRYRESGDGKLKIKGKVGKETQSFEYDVKFAEQKKHSRFGFCARLWAVRRIGEIIDLIDLEGQNEELVKELIDLSTQHGIVTPYTSYLADDLARPGDLADSRSNLERTRRGLEFLKDQSGQSGFAQRGFKEMLKSANSSSETRLAQNDRGGGIGLGGGLGGNSSASSGSGGGVGLGQGASGGLAPAQRRRFTGRGGGPGLGGGGGGSSDKQDSSTGKQAVRGAGKYTAYLREGNVLIASNATDVDPEKDKDKITEIARYSVEYFELVKSTSTDENQLLALQEADEEMIVRLQGKLYRLK